MKRTALMILSVLLLVACDESSEPLAPEVDAALNASVGPPDIIPGKFIVTLRPGSRAAEVAAAHRVQPDHIYSHVLNGFAGSISDAARSGLLRDTRVISLEPDSWIFPAENSQSNPTWGLDRIDQRNLPLDDLYQIPRTGSGVTVYVIDSGIRMSHQEFQGRAVNGHDFVWNDPNELDEVKGPEEGEDCSGHGTHVAGTVGGSTYGVAKDVDLVSVRVFGCSGGSPLSRVVAAMDWVTEDVTTNLVGTAVANMSLGGSGTPSARDAVRAMIAAGVATAASAGNGGREGGCPFPADEWDVMSVGATGADDWRASFSQYGDCVDWFAPGAEILSAGHLDDTDMLVASGTSMSAPHTSGVAALYLEAHPGAHPAEVFDALGRASTKDVVRDVEYEYHHRNGKIIGETEVLRGDLLFSLIDEEGVKPEITNLTAEALSASEIRLSWVYNAAETGEVEIQRYDPDVAEYATIALAPAGDGAFTDDGLESFTRYYYRLRVIVAGGTGDWMSVQAETEPGEDTPALSVNIYEYECPTRQDGRCLFKSQAEGPATSTTWRIEPEIDYGPFSLTGEWFTAVFTDPGDYTVIVTVADFEDNTAEDSLSVRCWTQGNKLRCE